MSSITKSNRSRTTWETTFASWTGPASDSEQKRYERTRNAINAALSEHPALAKYRFKVYPKGSYPNFTNVVRDSDVDVAAELTELYETEFEFDAEGLALEDVGGTPYTGSATLSQFKDDVETALVSEFGRAAVTRGTKAIHIEESSQSLAADVVACVSHKTYFSRRRSVRGIRLQHDKRAWEQIVNYPEQHLERGISKNDRTSKRYKRVVRILKRLENEMVKDGLIDAVPSFLIESAVWSVPDAAFNGLDWTARVREVLRLIFNGTLNDDCVRSNDWLEANGIKFLFHPAQNWTYSQLHEFADAAWDYIGFG